MGALVRGKVGCGPLRGVPLQGEPGCVGGWLGLMGGGLVCFWVGRFLGWFFVVDGWGGGCSFYDAGRIVLIVGVFVLPGTFER